jgi:diguanylate cyclase (GGDEF)-like protein
MSFRTRLTLFFVLIVVVPMIALGVVVVRVVSDSQHAKATAQNRASAAAALAAFHRLAQDGARTARSLARDPALAAALRTTATAADDRAAAAALAAERGLARVRVVQSGRVLVDVGARAAIARGAVRVAPTATGAAGGTGTAAPTVIEAATTTAGRFARTASTRGVRAMIARDGALLASTLPRATADPAVATMRLPDRGTVTLGDTEYTVSTFRGDDFGGHTTTVAILTDTSAAASVAVRGQWIAVALLALFLLLAFAGALLISRRLHAQLARLLTAVKRIGGGDFSTAIPVEGHDELAQLGGEFNKMSRELELRMSELELERGRLRESIQRIGATFAANLDRGALLEIGTQTIVDAVEADCGRAAIGASATADGALLEAARVGDLDGAEQAIAAAESCARATLSDPRDDVRPVAAQATVGDTAALAAPIPRGIVSVARRGRPFTEAERELVASLARQTGLSLENVDLHDQVRRQAVTDELTRLSNHRRFQEVIAAEAAAARRFDQSLALLMLDIDDFKRVNDTYGHQQGDLVLREVAAVLRDCSREVDEPARYGGEELAVALQQTDLAGAEAIAERVRTAVEALALPRLDGRGTLRVTVSCGVAASTDGDPTALVAAADAALYAAKRAGKNRTVRADALVAAGGAG